MPTSFITDRFVLDNKGAERLLEIIENSKAHPAKKIYKSNKYEEGKKLLKQYFPHRDKSDENFDDPSQSQQILHFPLHLYTLCQTRQQSCHLRINLFSF